MNHRFFAAAFAVGLACVGWVGLGFAGNNLLALAVTALIGAAFVLGAWELRQFRRDTATLQQSLAALGSPEGVPSNLGDWLAGLPASLRDAVRLRVEGDRIALPGPTLTPYLVGLLVMLGMLGTFLGMVVTFKGAVFALEGSGDLQAMRSALAEPIKGLGLSFGTSVAGVAASALLGLMSAIARRERIEAARALDAQVATALRGFSRARQREVALDALQAQAGMLPAVVDRLEALMARIETRAQALDQGLTERQDRFQQDAARAYEALALRVGQSLQDNLAAGARAAGDALQPVVEKTMAQILAQSREAQQALAQATQAQTDLLAQRFEASARGMAQGWNESQQALARELRDQWEQAAAQSVAHQQALGESMERAQAQAAARGDASIEKMDALQAAVARHLGELGAALEAPMSRMMQTAAEVPQAAAGVIAQLREELARMTERDNLALRERGELVSQLQGLVSGVDQATREQRAAVESLVTGAGELLQQAAQRQAQTLQAQAAQAGELSDQARASAIELASLGEAFAQGVQQFQDTQDKLLEGLQRLEAALERSTARSDEQLAYYVAQAREVIDLSIASQQGLVDSLRQMKAPAPLPAAAATPKAAALATGTAE